MRQIEEFEKQLNEAGFYARIWEKNGSARIYLNKVARDIKAYFVFDAPEQDASELDDIYNGVALKVYTDVSNQSANWILNRRKQVQHNLMLRITEAAKDGVIKSQALASTTVCEDWQDVILA